MMNEQSPPDRNIFAEIEGAQVVLDWFGFVPSFHDATLSHLSLGGQRAELQIQAFRTTSELDQRGYFKADRHARVTIRLSKLTGVILTGNDGASVIYALGIRKLAERDLERLACKGPEVGDFEIAIESSYGLDGALYGRSLTIELAPA